MIDIYFEADYGKLHETIEGGKSTVFKYETGLGKIQHMFIKREIDNKVDNSIWYDIVTPYGYGGPLVINYKEGKKDSLIKDFKLEFERYCKENNIVSEFVRFHPMVGNVDDFKEIYNAIYDRNTVGTKITDDTINKEFSKSTRKSIRRALNQGVTYKVTKSPNNINNFKEIYYSTMDRNNASEFYYFDDSYFEKALELLKDQIILVEAFLEDKIIASGFYFVYGQVIHAHLSGTCKDYLEYSPAYIIKHATANWAEENGIKIIHYGGGASNSTEDSLYNFKKKFTKETEFKFYIGKKIWNEDIYNKLCNINNVEKETGFFPAYRKR